MSTVVTSLRLASCQLRQSGAKSPDIGGSHYEACSVAFPFSQPCYPAVAQNGGKSEVGRITFEGASMQRYGSLTRCRGDVKMATHSFVLQADEVDFDSDTGIAEARGNVRIQLLPVTPRGNN